MEVRTNNVSASAFPMKNASSTSLLSLSSCTTVVVLLFSSVVARHFTSAAVRRWLRNEGRAVAGAEVDAWRGRDVDERVANPACFRVVWLVWEGRKMT